MLALPKKGVSRSVHAHNVDLAIVCDWLEASVLFDEDAVSGADVVDVLRENEIYADQDFAWELTTIALSNIRRRGELMGTGFPVKLERATRLAAKYDWRNEPAYAFCLLLSLPGSYPSWWAAFGKDFTEQGDLFEALTAESVAASLSGWSIHRTGWSRTTPNKLTEVADRVATLLGEATGDLRRWTKQKANEAGLDLLCFRPFPDGRVGVPVYLFQCASGADWKSKLKTPDLRIWKKVITFASDPKRAFSMPFALEDDEFVYHCNIVDGLLMDRHRLLAPGQNKEKWLSNELAERLVKWIEPRVATLPKIA